MSPKEQPRRLGRGLAALLGEDAPAEFRPGEAGSKTLPVEALEPSPYQARREMDEAALDELAESIRQQGILQPLLVRPKPDADGSYQIIAGERRWRAAQKAQLHEVPVLLRAFSDHDAMAAGLIENLQRENLNPVEEARGYQRLMKEFSITHNAMAGVIGKSRPYISAAMSILGLPEEVLRLVETREISAGHAKALTKHPNPAKGAQYVLKRQLSVRQTEDFVHDTTHNIRAGVLREKPPETPVLDPELEAVRRRLSERLGLDVRVNAKGESGTVVLSYSNLDQLDLILERLQG